MYESGEGERRDIVEVADVIEEESEPQTKCRAVPSLFRSLASADNSSSNTTLRQVYCDSQTTGALHSIPQIRRRGVGLEIASEWARSYINKLSQTLRGL